MAIPAVVPKVVNMTQWVASPSQTANGHKRLYSETEQGRAGVENGSPSKKMKVSSSENVHPDHIVENQVVANSSSSSTSNLPQKTDQMQSNVTSSESVGTPSEHLPCSQPNLMELHIKVLNLEKEKDKLKQELQLQLKFGQVLNQFQKNTQQKIDKLGNKGLSPTDLQKKINQLEERVSQVKGQVRLTTGIASLALGTTVGALLGLAAAPAIALGVATGGGYYLGTKIGESTRDYLKKKDA
jgi:hypothetical protein